MNTSEDSKIENLIKLQTRGQVVLAPISIIICSSIFVKVFSLTVIAIGLSLISSYFMHEFFKFILVLFLQHKFYKNDFASFVKDVNEAAYGEEVIPKFTETSFTIVNSSEIPIGFYKDEEIYEWLNIEDNEEVLKYEYFSTVNMDYDFNIPEDCIVINPGIVYKLKT